jgi:hypothetical protein
MVDLDERSWSRLFFAGTLHTVENLWAGEMSGGLPECYREMEMNRSGS